MKDLRIQIPLGCSMNIAIINEIKDHPFFLEACKTVPLKYGIKSGQTEITWPFYNFSLGAYMLYCQIVVPKEIYKLDKDDDYFISLQNHKAFDLFTIHKQKKAVKDDIKYHWGAFRNAISHVNYMDNGNTIIFWDHPPGKSEKENWHWYVEITYEKLYEFLNLVNVENIKFYDKLQ